MSITAEPPTATGTVTRILVADPIAEDGVTRLRAAGEVDVVTGLDAAALRERIGDYDALVVRSETKVTAEVFAAAPRLRVVGRAGVGVDNIDIDAATRHGVLVLNAPTGNTIAATEHVIAMMLALARNLPAADRSLHAGLWERSKFMGIELREKTLGVLGLGKIGSEVARIAREGLRMRVLAHDPLVTAERAQQAGVELCDFETLLTETDFLTVHVPLTDATRGVIGAAELKRMRKGARLINVARGGIIDEQALADAIRDGHIAGAAIDVFTKEPPDPGEPAAPARAGGGDAASRREHARGAGERRLRRRRPDRRVPRGRQRRATRSTRRRCCPRSWRGCSRTSTSPRRSGRSRRSSTAASSATSSAATRASSRAIDTSIVTAHVLRGLFAHFTETRVNPVNAKVVATSMGVDVDERHTTRSVDPEGFAARRGDRRADAAHRRDAVRRRAADHAHQRLPRRHATGRHLPRRHPPGPSRA